MNQTTILCILMALIGTFRFDCSCDPMATEASEFITRYKLPKLLQLYFISHAPERPTDFIEYYELKDHLGKVAGRMYRLYKLITGFGIVSDTASLYLISLADDIYDAKTSEEELTQEINGTIEEFLILKGLGARRKSKRLSPPDTRFAAFS